MERDNVREIMAAVEEALQPVAEKYGMTVVHGVRASYGETNMTIRAEFAKVGADGSVASREAESLKRFGHLYGLPKNALGRTFVKGTHTYTITGLARRQKFPVLAMRDDGMGYKFPGDVVAQELLKEVKA